MKLYGLCRRVGECRPEFHQYGEVCIGYPVNVISEVVIRTPDGYGGFYERRTTAVDVIQVETWNPPIPKARRLKREAG